MKFLILKLNVKFFNENAYIKNMKDYKNMNLINYNNFKKINNDKVLNDVDYNAKYKINENIKSDDNDLFIINFFNNC